MFEVIIYMYSCCKLIQQLSHVKCVHMLGTIIVSNKWNNNPPLVNTKNVWKILDACMYDLFHVLMYDILAIGY